MNGYSLVYLTVNASLPLSPSPQSSKYEEAEKLYKQVLTRAHEREFGQISNENKTIWQIAEEREHNKTQNVENQPLSDINGYHKVLDHWYVTLTCFVLQAIFAYYGH